MEQGESLQQAAVRELKEETGLNIPSASLQLAVLSSLTFINEVYIVYRCAHPEVALRPPSEEIQDIRFLAQDEAPWGELAYPHTEDYMRNFYREAAAGHFDIWLGEFSRKQQSLKKLHDHGAAS
jgi:ADP-ribose pyrophosphatase YjhB (NUDIX family)